MAKLVKYMAKKCSWSGVKNKRVNEIFMAKIQINCNHGAIGTQGNKNLWLMSKLEQNGITCLCLPTAINRAWHSDSLLENVA